MSVKLAENGQSGWAGKEQDFLHHCLVWCHLSTPYMHGDCAAWLSIYF